MTQSGNGRKKVAFARVSRSAPRHPVSPPPVVAVRLPYARSRAETRRSSPPLPARGSISSTLFRSLVFPPCRFNQETIVYQHLKSFLVLKGVTVWGRPGGSVGGASDFGSGHDLRFGTSSPTSGSVLTVWSLLEILCLLSPCPSPALSLPLSHNK